MIGGTYWDPLIQGELEYVPVITVCITVLCVQESDPTSLRAIYGHDNTKNGLHGSDSVMAAQREIKFMFPDSKCILNVLLIYYTVQCAV